MTKTVMKLCRVVSRSIVATCTRSSSSSTSTPIARAKLKPSQLYERGGIYGIENAFPKFLSNAKSKLFNELEHGGIDLRNDVR